MGSSPSRAQENDGTQENPQENVGTQVSTESNNEIQPTFIYIHEKYEELTYHKANLLEKPQRYISPCDLFYIAACLPDYCKSVHDMIRQAIRIESRREEVESIDYFSNFIVTERMDYSRSKVIERCQFRNQFKLILKDLYPLAIKAKSSRNSQLILNNKEVTFQDILTMLRYYWIFTNKKTIDALLKNFQTISGSPINNFTDENRFHQILSQILGNENCDAFVPHRNINWDEIQVEFNDLQKKLSEQTYNCCMVFQPVEPLCNISIQGKIIRHGICSNGTFLFLLSDEKKLYVYLIYKGLIEQLINQYNLNESWHVNDDTIMFCSQKILFIKDHNMTFQIPICEMIKSGSINFGVTKRPELANIKNACSNGASYIITNSDYTIQSFNAEKDDLIFNNKSQVAASLFINSPNSTIFLTNGWFIGLLGTSGKIISLQFDSPGLPYYYEQEDFPKNNDLHVEAATIDVLSNVYFSVSYKDSKSIVYSYPYIGSTDSSIFISKKKDGNYSSIGYKLFDYLASCALSSTIPENLISQSDNDLLCIIKWIETSKNDIYLVKGLLLLLDVNLRRHDNKNITQTFVPILTELIKDNKYKRLASALLVNNIDQLYDSFDDNLLTLIKIMFSHSSTDIRIYNGFLLSKLWQSSILSTININEKTLILLFGDEWFLKSRNDDQFKWIVDFLLQVQQNMVEDIVKLLEKDPLNLNDSGIINSLCNFANILLHQFHIHIIQITIEQEDKANRKVNSETILFTLISNFVATAIPITHCSQLASILTNEEGQEIVQLLNEFAYDTKLQLFIEYFYMIITLSLSGLIRGGSTYQCEVDYDWLINGNLNSGNRKLIPPDLSQIKYFLSSLDDEFMQDFIKNESEDIAFLYRKNRSFKPFKNEHHIIDRIIFATILHQTNTFDLLYDAKKQDKIKQELTFIINWVKKIRNRYTHALQHEIVENLNGEKQSDKFLANMGILIILDPVLIDFSEKNISDKTEYLHRLEQFIQNNDPYQFQKILRAIPKRIDNVLDGFDRLNSLFQSVQNQTLHRIIIDGISRVDSFERLGYLLSNAELNEHALTTLTIFCMTCIDMVCDFRQLSILEIIYTVLSNCKSFREKAIKVMNQLSEFINYNCFSVDSFFMTVAGLAGSTCTLPNSFYKIPEIGQAYIMKLILSKKEDSSYFSSSEILSLIQKNNNERLILNDVWIKMIFTILNKCQFTENESMFAILQVIFTIISQRFNNECTVFSSYPEIIYGFRYILNSGNEISQLLQNLLSSITIDSKIGDIFLLFSIIGADIADYSSFYAVRNQHGKWLKYTLNEKDYCLQIPISPFSERHLFDINEVNEPIQEEELNLEMSVSFETVISFWDICMRDQGSLLCRFYLQTLNRYIMNMNNKIPEKLNKILANKSKPYIDFHILSSKQTNLYISNNESFDSQNMLLPETDFGFGKIEQSNWTHLYAYNVLEHGTYSIHAIIINRAYVIIHNTDPIIIEFPNATINGSEEKMEFDDNILDITILNDESTIIMNNKSFPCEEFTSIEFIVHSTEDIAFEFDNQINFINSQISHINKNDINAEYVDDIFDQNEEYRDDFEDNLNTVKPINFKCVDALLIEREGNNIFYKPIIENISFNDALPFSGSSSTFNLICKTNENNICNQLKSVILAQEAINDPDSLDFPTCLLLIKSAVVAVGGFNKEKLFNGTFPYSLDEGFVQNCSLDLLQSKNVQVFFNSLQKLLQSKSFMDNLGKQLVIMARDRIYHSLIHKKDLIIIQKDQFSSYQKKENDYIIDFPDGSKGKIGIDQSGKWIIDTPIVFLLLLWIYIDNCSTSEQRICAKLALIDCWLIKSPMINKYMPEFLSYIERKMLFTPDDFNPIYIRHLSSLAVLNQEKEQIISFYESEKKCFNLRSFKLNDLDEYPKMKIDSVKRNIKPNKIIEILQLLKNYKSVDLFPYWNFISLWKEISSFSLNKIENQEITDHQINNISVSNTSDEPLLITITVNNTNDCRIKICDNEDFTHAKIMTTQIFTKIFMTHYILSPNEKKYFIWYCMDEKTVVVIQKYQITSEKISEESLKNDIQSFAVKWTDSDTEQLLSECTDIHFRCQNYIWTLIDSLNMTELNKKFGRRVVQCKLACLFIFNSINKLFSQFDQDHLTQKDDEMRSLGRENSKYLSYSERVGQFNIVNTKQSIEINRRICLALIHMIGFILLNVDDANKFISGESNDITHSMIYQVSNHIKSGLQMRFKNFIWGVSFKGKDAIDIGGVTNETITMATQSFLSSKAGICILSPNCNINNNDDEDNTSNIQVIPYPSKNDESIFNMLYAFGMILGSIIRGGITQDIPFPLFIWNFLSGKKITKEDVYENDIRLKEEIEGMKNGDIKDHQWVYRDWDNSIKPLNCCSDYNFVPQNLVDVYEKLVIECRIVSLEKYLIEIRKGLFDNQNIKDPAFLSGGLIMFLCQGKKTLDLQGIIKRIIFERGDNQLISNMRTILNEYDESMMKKFLMFSTAHQKPPNFAVVPEYCIIIEFKNDVDLTSLPLAHTCFKRIEMPAYPTIDIMREKLNYAINNCTEMDIG